MLKSNHKGGIKVEYVPIGFKSDYSLMKTLLKVNDIIRYAVEKKASYVGVLDDNPYGIMDFYEKCQANNLKCVFGMVVSIDQKKIYLYIKNYGGYLNIIKINALIDDEKLSLDELIKHNEGIIVVLPHSSYSLYPRLKMAFEIYLGYRNNDELLTAHNVDERANTLFVNEIKACSESELPLLKLLYKISEVEYESDLNYCLTVSDDDKKKVIDFITTIDLQFPKGKRYMPVFCKTEEESKVFLRALAVKGLQKRLSASVPEEYSERLKYELNVIETMGFTDYFLIVYDYVKFARQNDIMAVPRGSAAGSLVAYSLGISDVDPIKYDLLFERFLNPERVTMPDIDMDFEDTRRNEVIEYVKKRYGEDKVALIVAYGTMGSRQVIRDVGKALGTDMTLIDSLSKKIDAKKNLKENTQNRELVEFIKKNNLERLYKIACRLEGLKKHTTIHAAGVVISSQALLEIVPTYRTNDGILTGFTMEYLENLGLLKMDFLALRNLTIIHNMLKLVKKKNPKFELASIPFDDKPTFKVFQSADTDNIFQFESNGMKNFLRKLAPDRFDDLIAANALFRPGPMQNIDEYIERRKGIKSITYLHADLKPILKSTYGIIVYQEQIMQILSLMGGYTFAEADLIRRAMSKKKHDVMEKENIRFVAKASEKGYDKNIAQSVYDLIVKFANYGFNKSHSVAYARLGYQMAYLKANYSDIFQLNTLNMSLGSSSKIKDVINDAKNRGLNIVKPDINKSGVEYLIRDGAIILPLSCIKDVGSNVGKTIVDNAPYNDLFDFFRKTADYNINRRTVENLIFAGAFDSLGFSRNTLKANIDSAITYVELCKSLDESLIMKPEIIVSEAPDEEISELDVFGFYISGHPAGKVQVKNGIKLKDIGNYKSRVVRLAALVDKFKVINTKNNEKMAFVDLSDDTGTASAVIFPKNSAIIDNIEDGGIYEIGARIGERNGEVQLIIENIANVSI